MLACCIAARLWKESFIGTDVLEKNVICITFGQPLLAIPYVQKTVDNNPKFESTLHCIYDQEDAFPRLLRNNYSHSMRIDSGPPMMKALTSNGHSPTVLSTLAPESPQLDVSVALIIHGGVAIHGGITCYCRTLKLLFRKTFFVSYLFCKR